MLEDTVTLRGVHKRYGSVEALRGVDLTIRRGEVVAMLGPNGAGKTTAINMMLGLRRPTSGSARLFGLDPSDRRARSRCGVMLQESGITDVLKVREVIELFSSYYPQPMPVARALAMAGLEEQAERQIGKLSGGQKQRLYYGLAVCGDPDVIFLDEPTVGMDVEARRAFLRSIREFFREGKTVVLTTHYLEEADQLAERVVVIDHGVIIADAPPQEIKRRAAGKRISFSIEGAFREAALRGAPVSRVEVDGGRVRILSNQPEDVLRRLFESGIAIRDLEVVGADLEEAFLELTARDRSQPAAKPS